MSSLVELIFSAVGTEATADRVKKVAAAIDENARGLLKAGVVSEALAQGTAALTKIVDDESSAMRRNTLAAAEAAAVKKRLAAAEAEAAALAQKNQSAQTTSLLAFGAAALSARAIYSQLMGAIGDGAALQGLSARTGENIRDLVVLQQEFKNAGLGSDVLARSANLLEKVLGGLDAAGGPANLTLRRLGTSVEALKPLPLSQQLEVLNQGFARIDNQSDRAAIAMKLFGRSGGELLQVFANPHALREAEEQAGRLGSTMERDAAVFHDIEVRLNGVTTRIKELWVAAAEQLVPALRDVTNLLGGLNLSGLGSVLGAAGPTAGAGLLALWGGNALEGQIAKLGPKVKGTIYEGIVAAATDAAGLFVPTLLAGLGVALTIQIVAGIVDAMNQSQIQGMFDHMKDVRAPAQKFRDRAATEMTTEGFAKIAADTRTELIGLMGKRTALSGQIASRENGALFLDVEARQEFDTLTEKIRKLQADLQNIYSKTAEVGTRLAANQLAAARAAIAPLVAEMAVLEKKHEKLLLQAGDPSGELKHLQTERAAKEAELAKVPPGLNDEEKKARALNLENQILELRKEEHEVQSKIDAEAKRTAGEEVRRAVFALETRAARAAATGNEELANQLKEQAKIKGAIGTLDGIDLQLAKDRIDAEHQIWQQQNAQKKAREQVSAERTALENSLAAIREQLTDLEANYTRTEADKWQDRKAAIAQEIVTLQAAMHTDQLRAKLARGRGDEHTAAIYDQSASATGQKRAGAQHEQARLGPDPHDWVANTKKNLTDLQSQVGTTAQRIARSITGTIGGAFDSASQHVTAFLLRTESLGQMIGRIGLNIEQSLVGAIVDMGVRWVEQLALIGAQWVATKLGMAAADKSVAAASVAANVPIAAAQSALWAAPAALATIASFGGAAIAAPGEIAGAMAATAILAALPGFRVGGFVPGAEDQLAGGVHGGEFVFSAPAVRSFGVENLSAMHASALRPAASPSFGTAAGAGGSDGPPNLHVYLDRSAYLRAMRSDVRGIFHELYDQKARS